MTTEILQSRVAISHLAVRIRVLQRMAEKAEERGNLALAAKFIEMAAKEMAAQKTIEPRAFR